MLNPYMPEAAAQSSFTSIEQGWRPFHLGPIRTGYKPKVRLDSFASSMHFDSYAGFQDYRGDPKQIEPQDDGHKASDGHHN